MKDLDVKSMRSNFFPNSKTESSKSKMDRIKKNALERNTQTRQQEIHHKTKQDASVDIPDAVKDFSRIKKAVDQAPDIDKSEKVAQLKKQIAQGKYKFDYEALADKILASEF